MFSCDLFQIKGKSGFYEFWKYIKLSLVWNRNVFHPCGTSNTHTAQPNKQQAPGVPKAWVIMSNSRHPLSSRPTGCYITARGPELNTGASPSLNHQQCVQQTEKSNQVKVDKDEQDGSKNAASIPVMLPLHLHSRNTGTHKKQRCGQTGKEKIRFQNICSSYLFLQTMKWFYTQT